MTGVTADEFRKAMSHFATGVAVVMAAGDEGEHGATISALSSVSLDPLTLLVCLNRKSATCRAIEKNGSFGLSILRRDQADIARHFAMPAHAKIVHDHGIRHADGTSFVRGALVQIGLEVVETLRGGTHEVFMARPLHIAMNVRSEVEPLLYYRGTFDLTP
ncbi:flavin reductase [Gluconacetobacter azotocaptans]|uniref:Flavin reductase n=1 Tax=Gluconacetobacter azotocaptans TaxID=142834 RepID=A0A7W4JVN8_9PROT|nr:flavin reductase family protein [Gluconacetobacter azotocaptans]MBB2191662.1 flavin reductase [Gluconacetobacter azotocaptans]GBQ34068.1 flavin mononucleotide reductase [Gluconacetobacter azotocaptans DSM 13594]